MDRWDTLTKKFEEYQNDRTKIDLDRFVSKYLILFNRNGTRLSQEEATELLHEYKLEINPYKPVSVIRNLNGVGEEEVVLRLPPIETEVPTLNECEIDNDIIDVVYNKLEQYSRNPILNNGLGDAILVTADKLADKAIENLSKKDEYAEVMDELEQRLSESDDTSTEISKDDIVWE